jgi:Fur family ferric uptake transcriptional regulator
VVKSRADTAGSKRSRSSSQEHAELLRKAGLRKTTPRIAVLELLENATTPRTHGEIAADMAGLGFDRATIYRNLIDLVEADLVSRSDLGDHVWRFEMRRPEARHARQHSHFLCVDCGGVTCLPGGAVRLVSARGLPRAVLARDVEVQVKGRCDACAH